MFQPLQNWHLRPRALGILLAKAILSFATPLAGQPGEIMPIVRAACVVPAQVRWIDLKKPRMELRGIRTHQHVGRAPSPANPITGRPIQARSWGLGGKNQNYLP